MAKFQASWLLLCALICGITYAAQPLQEKCHVLISKQCINLVGTWKVDHGKKSSPDTLLIKAAENRSKFSFEIEITRGGSYTSFGGEFQLKNTVELYSGPNTIESDKQCTLVFLPLSATKMSVTSFGTCEEGFRASPDGTYTKAMALRSEPSNPPLNNGRAKNGAPVS